MLFAHGIANVSKPNWARAAELEFSRSSPPEGTTIEYCSQWPSLDDTELAEVLTYTNRKMYIYRIVYMGYTPPPSITYYWTVLPPHPLDQQLLDSANNLGPLISSWEINWSENY